MKRFFFLHLNIFQETFNEKKKLEIENYAV
jgi:hypothetical protein